MVNGKWGREKDKCGLHLEIIRGGQPQNSQSQV